MQQAKLYRVIDANFNRAKEGLRVCEDVCRFVLDDKKMTGRFKKARHELTQAISAVTRNTVLQQRNVVRDVGTGTFSQECKRRNVTDVFYANIQRVKESMRVLEEFSKVNNSRKAIQFKKLRYRIYALEKDVSFNK